MRLIDADKMVADIKYQNDILQAMGLGDYADVLAKGFLQEIDNQPTVDAVPVVRCKDCKNWDRTWTLQSGLHFCPMIGLQTAKDWFCADGERREEDT